MSGATPCNDDYCRVVGFWRQEPRSKMHSLSHIDKYQRRSKNPILVYLLLCTFPPLDPFFLDKSFTLKRKKSHLLIRLHKPGYVLIVFFNSKLKKKKRENIKINLSQDNFQERFACVETGKHARSTLYLFIIKERRNRDLARSSEKGCGRKKGNSVSTKGGKKLRLFLRWHEVKKNSLSLCLIESKAAGPQKATSSLFFGRQTGKKTFSLIKQN